MVWTLAVLGSLLAVQRANAGSPPVRVSLTPSWPDPPVVAEVLETVGLVNPDGFFHLLDKLTDPHASIFAQSSTPQVLYQSGISSAVTHGVIQSDGDLAEAHMNLFLHAATPKLEAFYQHYEDRHNQSHGTACGSWVDWYGKVVCDLQSLEQLVEEQSSTVLEAPKILTFDHIHPSPSTTIDKPHRTAILYATLDSDNFRELHSYLYSQANKPDSHFQYVLRYVPPQGARSKRNYLSGYGVSLDLKKMDYLAIDDRFSTKKQSTHGNSQPADEESNHDLDAVSALIQAHPENETVTDAKATLTEEEFNILGHQAVQIIADSTNPLQTLTTLSQNFPKFATSLSRRVQINSTIDEELAKKARMIPAGSNYFWFNGQTVAPRDVHVFTLMNLLKKEKSLMKHTIGLGLGPSEALEVMTHSSVTNAQKDGLVTDGMLDASDRPEKGEVIVWFNDIETDLKYMPWHTSILGVLQAYPGSMPKVRRNLLNIVLVLDLHQSKNIQLIGTLVYNVVSKGLPYRFGLVPLVENEDSIKMAKVISYMLKNFGWKITTNYCQLLANPTDIYEDHPEFVSEFISLETAKGTYASLLGNEMDKSKFLSFDDIIGDKDKKFSRPSFTIPVDKINRYVERLSAGTKDSATGRGHVFFNGKPLTLDNTLADALQAEAAQQMQLLQEKVYLKTITDETNPDMSNYFYDLPTTQKRRNKYIVPATSKVRVVSVPEILTKSGLDNVIEGGSWMYPESDKKSVTMSLFVVADFDSEEGKDILERALEFVAQTSGSRITFLHNPSTTPSKDTTKTGTSSTLAHLITKHTLSELTSQKLAHSLGLSSTVLAGSEAEQQQAPLDFEDDFDSEAYGRYVKASRLAVRALGMKGGEGGVVINGRVIAPIEKGQFSTTDFEQVTEFENKRRAVPVVNALKDVKKEGVEELDRISYANVVSMLTSTIGASQQPDPSEVGLFDTPPRPRTRNYQMLNSEHTSIRIGNNQTALYHVAVVMDPLSLMAQKWSALLQWLSTVPDVFVEIHLSPGRYTEMPLRRFYRYNVIPHATLRFDKATGLEVPSEVIFNGLPIDPIYTLAMDVPPSWLVRPREALYDLDNILLTELSSDDKSVDAKFSLDYLVVEGHARDTKTFEPPRGVQLELVRTSDKTPIDDTLVVANLGYLQFKAKPGVFQLQIREGRGRKIFRMESVGNEGWNSPSVEEVGDEIALVSFEGTTLYPRLERLPGMEYEDVLDEERSPEPSVVESLTNKVMSMFGKEQALTTVEEQADINIFTVASGLLYERFASIMILSVLRNTKSSVKFWFIENFLSPSFLEFIPHMAEKYGFKYELVTYKWPSWLRAQTEKQRIIWAYKILFLDVLFPMDLKKVVFVDADQIVRADLQELVDLDIHGAPYAFTPMGDDNTSMEGFRFWKTGYWKDFLKGLPYHISALYVIDLWKFRQMTAGDILRGHYQALSADPHSLSNLDQDLPNNLQREVPIFSLPEDWLWCETWCSKDRLDRAKTIDLCQNPLTKEPKLSRARQIPEWEEYDAEIARFARELAKEGKIHSRIATADADVLASASAAALVTDDTVPAPVEGERDYMEEYEDDDDSASSSEASPAGESKTAGRDEL